MITMRIRTITLQNLKHMSKRIVSTNCYLYHQFMDFHEKIIWLNAKLVMMFEWKHQHITNYTFKHISQINKKFNQNATTMHQSSNQNHENTFCKKNYVSWDDVCMARPGWFWCWLEDWQTMAFMMDRQNKPQEDDYLCLWIQN